MGNISHNEDIMHSFQKFIAVSFTTTLHLYRALMPIGCIGCPATAVFSQKIYKAKKLSNVSNTKSQSIFNFVTKQAGGREAPAHFG